MAQTYIDQFATEVARIQGLIAPNNVRAITGQVHQDNEVGQAADAYANLLPYDGFGYKIVRTVGTDIENGTLLKAAVIDAATMEPGGNPLAEDNRATIFLMPGTYSLGRGYLDLIHPFIDLVGLSTNEAQVIITSTADQANVGTIRQDTDNIQIRNITIVLDYNAYSTGANTESAAYFPTRSFPNTLLENVVFRAPDNGNLASPTRTGVEYSGTYRNVRTEIPGGGTFPASGMFGLGATCSGTFEDCNTVLPGFGSGAGGTTTSTAVFKNCSAMSGFGSDQFSGVAEDCVAGSDAFGGAPFGSIVGGKLTRCTVTGTNGFGGIDIDSASVLKDCEVGLLGFGFTLGAALHGQFIRCRSVAGAAFAPYGGAMESTSYFEDCFGGISSFGGSLGSSPSTLDGSFLRCEAGANSFGGFDGSTIGGTASFNNCNAGNYSFCGSSAPVAHGVSPNPTTIANGASFIYCGAGNGSFGVYATIGSGSDPLLWPTFDFCTAGALSFGWGCWAGLANFRNCIGTSTSFCYGGAANGNFTDCVSGGRGFGSDANRGAGLGQVPDGGATGTFTRCKGGDGSFGSGFSWAGYISGTFDTCIGGVDSFGAGEDPSTALTTISGATFINCQAGIRSFCGTTTNTSFTGCTAGDYSFGRNVCTSTSFVDCIGGKYSFGGREGLAGLRIYTNVVFTRCTGGDFSFGGCDVTLSADATSITFTDCEFTDCKGGVESFGGVTTTGAGAGIITINFSSPIFKRCSGTGASFCGNATGIVNVTNSMDGVLEDCEAGERGFCGGNGTLASKLVRCNFRKNDDLSADLWRGKEFSGEMHDCIWNITGAGETALMVVAGAKIYNSTITCDVGTGASIVSAGGAINISYAHCRINVAVDVNITNNIGTPYNVVDSDV